jgi:hypothetical protein
VSRVRAPGGALKALFLMTVSIGDGVFFVAFSGKQVIYIMNLFVSCVAFPKFI